MSRTPRRTTALLALLALVALVACLAPRRASAQAITKLADPDTSSRWEEVLGGGAGGDGYSTDQAGRIWVDKSVFGSADEAKDAGVLVDGEVGAHDFVVGLSALSSAASVRQESAESPAHDVVFVVSVNNVLTSMPYATRPQAAWLADALNDAIARLMAENDDASTTTRVGVVCYSSQVTTLMPLDVWEPDAKNGNYVQYDEEGNKLTLVASSENNKTGDATSVGFSSGAYLQRATYVAGEMLAKAAGDDGAAKRTPVLALMGIDTPPMASTNYLNPPEYGWQGAGFLGPRPDSNVRGYGTDALLATMLTMRSEKNRVNGAWEQHDRKLALYTTGLDTSGAMTYLLQTAEEQEATRLSNGTIDLGANLDEAAETMARAQKAGDESVTLSLYGSGTSDIVKEDVTFAVTSGLVDENDPARLSVVDDYLEARSAAALRWSLGTVVDYALGVVYTAPTSGGPGASAPGGSRVTVSDEVGAGMEVERVEGIVYGDDLLDGSLAAQAVVESFKAPWEPEPTHEMAYLIEAMDARYDLGEEAYNLFYEAILDNQISYDENNKIFSNHVSWYVNANHEMVKNGTTPYFFAHQAAVDAATGDWKQDASGDVRSELESAQAAGATAVCETYFYIGNLPNQYTGGDVTLYDFIIMVETDLTTGRQTVLASVPVEAVPARRLSVSVHPDGKVTMALDGEQNVQPLRLAYVVSPTSAVEALLERIENGEIVSDAELEAATGAEVESAGMGRRVLLASETSGEGADVQAGAVAAAWSASTNAYYEIVRDTPLYASPSTDEPLTSLPKPGGTYYFQRSVYTANLGTSGEPAPATAQKVWETLTVKADASQIARHFSVVDGQCIALAGTPRYVQPVKLGTVEKATNVTGSAPYAELLTLTESSEGGVRLEARLGNNGALVLPAGVGTGSILVQKHVEAAEGTPTAGGTFDFTVTLTDGSDAPLSGKLAYSVGGAEQTAVLDETGSFSAKLADGQELVVEDVPAGTRYVVREADYTSAGYLTLREGSAGVVEADTVAQATFTNVWQPGALGIASVMAGNDAEPDRTVTLEVTVEGLFKAHPDENELIFAATRYAGATASEEQLTFTRGEGDNGVATIEGLAGGSGVLVEGLPQGARYEVSVLNADELLADGYTIYAGNAEEVAAGNEATSAEGTIAGDDAVSAAYFVHVREKDVTPEPEPMPEPTPDPEPTPEPEPEPTPEPDQDANPGVDQDASQDTGQGTEPAPEQPANDGEPLPDAGDALASPLLPLGIGVVVLVVALVTVVVQRKR